MKEEALEMITTDRPDRVRNKRKSKCRRFDNNGRRNNEEQPGS